MKDSEHQIETTCWWHAISISTSTEILLFFIWKDLHDEKEVEIFYLEQLY